MLSQLDSCSFLLPKPCQTNTSGLNENKSHLLSLVMRSELHEQIPHSSRCGLVHLVNVINGPLAQKSETVVRPDMNQWIKFLCLGNIIV